MRKLHHSSWLRAAVLGLSASALVGCAGSTPTIDTSAEAEPTYDGLYPVHGGRMDAAWARPGFNVEEYSKVMLKGVGVEYRPDGSTRRGVRSTSNTTDHYEISADRKATLEEKMKEAFLEEMAKSEQFELVTEAGPDVLVVIGGLTDVTSFVPPDPIGNGDIYLSRVGEATLVLELRDSMTGAILVRAIDRRAAESVSQTFTNSNSVSTTAEFRRLARTWGGMLRDGLDRFMAEGDEAGE